LSLVEVAVSTFLVGVLLIAAMNTVGAVFRSRRTSAQLHDAPTLARLLMTEILQAPYQDPEEPDGPIGLEGGEASGSRSQFDDVDDYDGWSECPPKNKDSSNIPGHGSWQRDVTVDWVVPDTLSTSSTDTGLKQITVTVTHPGGTQTQLVALRCQWGAVEQPPGVDTTVVTWVGAQLEIGSDAAAVLSATNLVNHADDR